MPNKCVGETWAEVIGTKAARQANGCLEWQFAKLAKGYGCLKWKGKRYTAHRLSFALAVADPGDRHVLHRCDNPACVDPGHLFLGTQADNVHDMMQKGRQSFGHRLPLVTHCHNGHELTPDNTRREASGKRRCKKCSAANTAAYLLRRGR